MSEKKNGTPPSCADCSLESGRRVCLDEEGIGSRGCPTVTRPGVLREANEEFNKPDVREFARQASIQEAECYANRHQRPYILQPTKTRIVEICEFARKMNYTRIGLAFCLGLVNEARIVSEVFRDYGLEVVSVLCKAGGTSKAHIGIRDEEKIYQGTDEPMCNPIYQAKLMNFERTELNVLLGLCVGHDSLFFKYADAPTTVLAVKDRVTGHNPLSPIYLSESYYRKIKHPNL